MIINVCLYVWSLDLRWVQVNSSEEAYRVMKIGKKNQSFSVTRLNQLSSRRCGAKCPSVSASAHCPASFNRRKHLTVPSYSSFVFDKLQCDQQNVWFYSHSIFSIRIIRVEDIGVPRVLGISEWVHQVKRLTSNEHKFAISHISVYCQTCSVWPRWIRTLLTYSEHRRETEGGRKHQQLTPHAWKVYQRP